MWDVAFVTVTALFFVLSFAYVAGCGRLMR